MKHAGKIAAAVMFGLLSAVVVCAVSRTVAYHNFLRLQNAIDDSHSILWKNRKPPRDDIVIVTLDDSSMARLGNFKRWPRRHFASVINRVNEDGARLVFFDVMLMRGGPSHENRALADTVSSAGNVIFGYYFDLSSRTVRKRPLDSVSSNRLFLKGVEPTVEHLRASEINLPFPELVRSARKLGFANCIPDPDGVVRHIPLFVGYNRSLLSAASLQMWMYLKEVRPSEAAITPYGVQFGSTFIPTDRYSFMRLNFRAAGYSHPQVSFARVLDGDFPPGTFRGKIVMVGATSPKLGDIKRVPGRQSLPGVELHAAALSTLLNGGFIRVAPAGTVILLGSAAGIIAGLLLVFLPLFPGAAAAGIGIPFALYAWSVQRFIGSSELVNIAVPSVTAVFMVIMMAIHRFVERHEHIHGKL